MPSLMTLVAGLAAAANLVAAATIAQINGNRYTSPLQNQHVANVTGLVTAVAANGIYLRSTEPDDDPATSESIFVFDSSLGKSITVGDIVSIDGQIQEYRSNKDYIYTTELSKPTGIIVHSSGNEVMPLVVGVDTLPPPTTQYSGLDEGDIFGLPNAARRVSEGNPELDPTAYGLDYWESLMGELVTVKDVYQISRPNRFGDTWVRGGDLKVTGLNGHGGLTMLDKDENPEAVLIGSPLDGSKNPSDTKMGDFLGDVTGVITNAFGFYRILPLTHLAPITNASAEFPAVTFESRRSCRGITVADYNAENLAPDSKHLPSVIDQIVNKLRLPDLIFLQEVQDNSGPTNDGETSANVTLTTLVHGIEDASGVVYEFADVDPVNNQDGGQPGGNIRVAYLYRSDRVELYQPNQGSALDTNEVIDGPVLKYNPGRIDPANSAWENSRKPLVAMWKPVKGTGKPFFTVNVHFGSKGGSSSIHGDLRPPVNKGVEKRGLQAGITADFIAQILDKDPRARIITAGDFNEFAQVRPITEFASKSGLVDLDEVVDMDPIERYTYLFDMNSQALDHMFVSESLRKGALYEHLHLNTWQNFDDQVSDHDPSVARFNMCGCSSKLE